MEISNIADLKVNTERHNNELISKGYHLADICNKDNIIDKRRYWESQGYEVKIEGRVFDGDNFVIPYNGLKPVFVKEK